MNPTFEHDLHASRHPFRLASTKKTAAFAAPAVVSALLLASCSATIKPEGAAKSVVDVVSRQTGFHPSDVECPSGVKAKVGTEFDCHFTGPDGPYTAHMRITKIDGDDVQFDVESRRS
ncbi:DUF4333 domain-containing protein [Skermania sp. ID1734]|uniref:DUF4333 domain-containing protein n=1 Tax=Skermania sp. ID1734 TaxID=2597516 RepID=UPI0011814D29|nr:DUF4333 domain-containing protein [Skermania sp. ID1734]TSE01680.1 DUF4333 domain-containing protein [Skermania sp. ID1734]